MRFLSPPLVLVPYEPYAVLLQSITIVAELPKAVLLLPLRRFRAQVGQPTHLKISRVLRRYLTGESSTPGKSRRWEWNLALSTQASI